MASLHHEALTACDLDASAALSDRDLAVLLLRALTSGRADYRRPRWAHLAGALHHGAGVRQALLRAAGIPADELTGWSGRGTCPTCGADAWDDDSEEVSDGG